MFAPSRISYNGAAFLPKHGAIFVTIVQAKKSSFRRIRLRTSQKKIFPPPTLRPIVPYIIQRPCILNYDDGDPFRVFIDREKNDARDGRDRINDKEDDVKKFFVP
jgi:hypothetical protein